MEQTSHPVLGDVFAPVDVLTVPARLDLAAILTVPGRSPAILPAELAARTLPAAPDALTAVGEAIASGIGAPAISVLREHRLDAVVRCCAGAPGMTLPGSFRGASAGSSNEVPAGNPPSSSLSATSPSAPASVPTA